MMTLVHGSFCHAFTNVTSSASALLPRLTKRENPTCSARAMSRIEVQRAPDWDMKAMVPREGMPAANEALSLAMVSMIPRQLGPMRRMP